MPIVRPRLLTASLVLAASLDARIECQNSRCRREQGVPIHKQAHRVETYEYDQLKPTLMLSNFQPCIQILCGRHEVLRDPWLAERGSDAAARQGRCRNHFSRMPVILFAIYAHLCMTDLHRGTHFKGKMLLRPRGSGHRSFMLHVSPPVAEYPDKGRHSSLYIPLYCNGTYDM